MRWLVRLYPARWRQRYGDEFDAYLDAEPGAASTGFDVARGALDAHRREGGLPMRFLPWLLVLFCNAFLGWLNYHASDDVQPVAAGLLVAGFGFALWRPRLAWVFVPLLWLSIPVSGVVADATNYHPGLAKPHPLYETLVAMIPTMLGALAGAGLRLTIRSSGPKPQG